MRFVRPGCRGAPGDRLPTRAVTGVEIHPAAQIGTGVLHRPRLGRRDRRDGGDRRLRDPLPGRHPRRHRLRARQAPPDPRRQRHRWLRREALGPDRGRPGAKVGANTVVVEDVPPDSTVVGNPGHPVRVEGRKPEARTPTGSTCRTRSPTRSRRSRSASSSWKRASARSTAARPTRRSARSPDQAAHRPLLGRRLTGPRRRKAPPAPEPGPGEKARSVLSGAPRRGGRHPHRLRRRRKRRRQYRRRDRSGGDDDRPAQLHRTADAALQRSGDQASRRGGTEACGRERSRAKPRRRASKDTNVSVDGAKATAEVEFKGGPLDSQTLDVALVEAGGDWKLDQVEGFADYDGKALGKAFETRFEEAPEGLSAGDGELHLPQGRRLERGGSRKVVLWRVVAADRQIGRKLRLGGKDGNASCVLGVSWRSWLAVTAMRRPGREGSCDCRHGAGGRGPGNA